MAQLTFILLSLTIVVTIIIINNSSSKPVNTVNWDYFTSKITSYLKAKRVSQSDITKILYDTKNGIITNIQNLSDSDICSFMYGMFLVLKEEKPDLTINFYYPDLTTLLDIEIDENDVFFIPLKGYTFTDIVLSFMQQFIDISILLN